MTMSPSGVAPNVPAVAPLPILSASAQGLGGVAAHDLDGVAVLRRPGADGGGHVARADDADGGHDECSSVVCGSVGCDGLAGVMRYVESVGRPVEAWHLSSRLFPAGSRMNTA